MQIRIGMTLAYLVLNCKQGGFDDTTITASQTVIMSIINNLYSPTENHVVFPSQRPFVLSPGGRSDVQSKAFGRQTSKTTLALSWLLIVTAAIGLCLTSYLSWVSLTSSKIVGCGGGEVFDCSHVLQSKWSTVFGIPVGLPAAFLYLSVLAAVVLNSLTDRKKLRQIASSVITAGAMAAGLAAIWFILLQVFVVEHLCGYCLAAHACGLVLSAIVLWSRPLGNSRTIRLAALSLVGVAVLATGQLMGETPATYKIENYAPESGGEGDGNYEITTDEENIFSGPGFDSPSSNESGSQGEVFKAPVETDSSQYRYSSPWLIADTSLAVMFVMAPVYSQLATTSSQQENSQQTKGEKPANVQDENGKSADTSKNEAEERRLISIAGGKARLDVKQWPLIGSADAKLVIVEMFDYTCPHCRANHKSVKGAKDQIGEDLAILALSVPLNSDCNSTVQASNPIHADACELSRLSVAVWRVAPEKFAEFHEWLFSGDSAPTARAAKLQAESLVTKEKLDAELAKDIAKKYVAKQVELYKMAGAGNIPKLLFPKTTVVGKVETADALIRIIEQQSTQR